ncbi:hypothetical protein [Leadbettera azotonutricia]|uniref:Uncharacterized protein n=1 Tax=Leadbettera azotonutricia (strain ATCC BAA-888 / DSM 13862 / ZAS-9) TaxID=545695 RepID=F5YDN0_LEAAZ|nr:hypothetical protein [Leadbettera azotonutricia]AEF81067.1 hypothetical protein TREAZ_0291 [Leadbettera azotonutricia ZAS-9]
MSDRKSLIPQLKDTAIFVGWVAGIVLIAALCWFLTQNFRAQFLLRSVNRALSQVEESKRFGELDEPIQFKDLDIETPRIGSWFSLKGKEGYKVLVFSLIAEGNFLPCAAVVNASGKVEDIVPLNSNAAKFRLPSGTLDVYKRRIEGGKE